MAVNPYQRIIFASAFMKNDAIMKSERNLRHVEIMQKPFRLAKLVDTLEFREIYLALRKHKVDIEVVRAVNPTHGQIKDLLNRLGIIKCARSHNV